MEIEIIDAQDPLWQQKAFEMVDANKKFRVKNLRREQHEEEILKLMAYGRSKLKPLERFEGVFDSDGMTF